MFRVARRGFFIVILVPILVSILVPLLLSQGGVAGAANDGPDELIRRALELRKKGNDQAALPLFQEAYKKEPSARAAGQLGFCHQGLGQWAEAETYLTASLDKESDPWVKKNRAVIEEALGVVRSHVARIEVLGEPAGADVLVTGNLAGKLPLKGPVHVSAGEVEVEVRAEGFVPKSKVFRVEGGQYQRVVLRLERQPATVAPGIASAPGLPTGQSHLALSVPGEDVRGAAPDARGGYGVRRALKWAAWGVGLVGAGVGIYGMVENSRGVGNFDKGCGLDAKGNAVADTPGFTTDGCELLKRDYESAQTIAIIGFAGAGVFAAGGLALWLTEGGPAAAPPMARWNCVPRFGARGEPGIAGIRCSLRF